MSGIRKRNHKPAGFIVKKYILIIFGLILFILLNDRILSSQKDNYIGDRIKDLKLGSQAWTFRKFSFYEMLNMMHDLKLHYLEAYPGQVLDKNEPDVKFDHYLSDVHITEIKQVLKDNDIILLNYGVVGFDNNEKSAQTVFEFAKKMGVQTIITEPNYNDYSIIEKMVEKYNIQVAVHNHPYPSKYAYPKTVLNHINGLDERIGACVDIGHWLRTGVDPIAGLKLLEGRILDVHLEDLDEIGSKNANTVSFGEGMANVHDILAELTRKNYYGMLAIELEQEQIIFNPIPTIEKSKKYIDDISYYKDWEEILVQENNGWFTKNGWNHYG
ncbi:MAG: hypothetical protein CMG74_09875, partial [Candidatus Marinimicrobia bacterium]|nr:hypothetical protein [Candidatus Neomarinimicrobiota bacterium]